MQPFTHGPQSDASLLTSHKPKSLLTRALNVRSHTIKRVSRRTCDRHPVVQPEAVEDVAPGSTASDKASAGLASQGTHRMFVGLQAFVSRLVSREHDGTRSDAESHGSVGRLSPDRGETHVSNTAT